MQDGGCQGCFQNGKIDGRRSKLDINEMGRYVFLGKVNMNIEEQLLTASIRDTINLGERAVDKLYSLAERRSNSDDWDGDGAEEYHEAEDVLRYYVEKAFRDVAILAERLGLPILRAEISEKMSSFSDLVHIEPVPRDVMMFSPPLQAANNFFRSMAIMTEGREITGLRVFEQILENTGKIIAARGLTPDRETAVSDAVLEVLKFAFPDATKTVNIPKSLKTYKPDIGVKSLLAAAEYKYANTKEKAKSVLDGIYADMRGYYSKYEWRNFYAVIYQTETFYTQKDVEREFQLVRADLNWRPVVVFGKGGR